MKELEAAVARLEASNARLQAKNVELRVSARVRQVGQSRGGAQGRATFGTNCGLKGRDSVGMVAGQAGLESVVELVLGDHPPLSEAIRKIASRDFSDRAKRAWGPRCPHPRRGGGKT